MSKVEKKRADRLKKGDIVVGLAGAPLLVTQPLHSLGVPSFCYRVARIRPDGGRQVGDLEWPYRTGGGKMFDTCSWEDLERDQSGRTVVRDYDGK